MIKIILLRLFETYFRHRWLYLIPFVVMMIVAGVFIATAEPKYIAKGVLYVQPQSYLAGLTAGQDNESNWWMSVAQATTGEMKELLQTDAFIRATIQKTDLEDQMDGGKQVVDELIKETRENVGVQVLGNNQVLIGASNRDPKIALQLTTAVLESYIQWNINSEKAQGEVALAFFRDLLEQYGTELEAARQEMRDYIDAHPGPLRGERPVDEQMEIGIIQSKITQLEEREGSARDKEESARLSLTQLESDAHQSYSLIDAPVLPDKPETSRREMAVKLATFLGVGVLISVAGVVGAALLDRSFRFPVDVQQAINLPILAVIPDVGPRISWWRRLLARRKRIKRPIMPIRETRGVQVDHEGQAIEEPAEIYL